MIVFRDVKSVAPVLDKDGVAGRKIYDYDNAQAVHITFEKDAALPLHKTPVDVFFYILEGEAQVQIGEETINVQKDNIVDSPKNIQHSIKNVGQGVLKVLVVKAPKP